MELEKTMNYKLEEDKLTLTFKKDGFPTSRIEVTDELLADPVKKAALIESIMKMKLFN